MQADRLLRIYALDRQNLVTVSTARAKSPNTVSYILQVWSVASMQVSIYLPIPYSLQFVSIIVVVVVLIAPKRTMSK